MNQKLTLIFILMLTGILFVSSFSFISAATTIKVGASPTPHAQILELIKPQLAKAGINLQIVVFQDLKIISTKLTKAASSRPFNHPISAVTLVLKGRKDFAC